MPPRRFPSPWTAEVTPNCFVVRDANGQQIAYVYYGCESGRRSAAKLLSKDEARRIASNIAKLPELLKKNEASRSVACQARPRIMQGEKCTRPEILKPTFGVLVKPAHNYGYYLGHCRAVWHA